MWKKFDMDFKMNCDMECGFSPPPEFNIPPPPLPPYLMELPKCSEMVHTDYEMCTMIPLIDFDNNSSMQTSAMILLCSVLVLIFIFVSSIFVWKHKRRLKDSVPYKTSSTSSTSSPMDPTIMFNGYENPDAFIIRYKTLERQQQHFNMLQPKTVHYPSGFPMPQTPPVFICSSPGPDPYESSSNLYEELEQHNIDSELSQNDRSLREFDRVSSPSENLNSSADTAIADEMANGNGRSNTLQEHETSSNAVSVISCFNTNARTSESAVEWCNRINVANTETQSAAAFNMATIFRDHNPQQHTARAKANYYAPPHNMMVANGRTRNSGYCVNNEHFSTPRAMPCWGSQLQNQHQFYEPIGSPVLARFNNFNQNSNDFAIVRNFHSLRSPHHISQNTINSRKNLWSWFRTIKRN